jgi:hypothetical protein
VRGVIEVLTGIEALGHSHFSDRIASDSARRRGFRAQHIHVMHAFLLPNDRAGAQSGLATSPMRRILQGLCLALALVAFLTIATHPALHADGADHGGTCPLCHHAGGSPDLAPPHEVAFLCFAVESESESVPSESFAFHSRPAICSTSPRGPPVHLS